MQTQPTAVALTSKKANLQHAEELRGSVRADAMLLLATSGHDDPAYVQATAEWEAIFERIRERCGIEIALELEAAVNWRVAAAEDAVARAWLRERGSIAVTL